TAVRSCRPRAVVDLFERQRSRPSASLAYLQPGLEKRPARRGCSTCTKAGRTASQFLLQPAQGLDVVDIVPFRKQHRSEADFIGALACNAGDGFRSPGDAREQFLMRMLQPNEIVAA